MKQVFDMIPPTGSGLSIFSGGIFFLLAGALALFAYIIYSSWHIRFEVSPGVLKIRGGLYGRSVPLSDLVLDRARMLNLQEDTEYGLSWRTNGIGLPGYKAGWFKLKNGEKALVFITDPRRVAYVPTRRNFALMVSVASPAGFLDALKDLQHSLRGGRGPVTR
jgi:Bacterial PH domain